MAITSDSSQGKISKIDITHDRISGRGGLFFFLKFVEQIGFFKLFETTFSHLKRSRKGLKLESFIRQILAYFVEGSDLSLLSFDRRKRDQAYAALLGEGPSELASSHQMKRFFSKFSLLPNRVYRGILLHLFLWRLWMTRPTVIVLFVDSKVFDNDTAHKREGVTPTYRGVKGYHPLHIIWNGFVVDALFRPGNHHSNHGSDFIRAVGRLVQAIRKRYSANVPIIVTMDSGFFGSGDFPLFGRLSGRFLCVQRQTVC
ncbi:MAG: transposase [candidate division KSB1 bacterium]|nr:transposase [candidate division KSB1 bacterium]